MISLKIITSIIIIITCCFSIVYEYIELIEENLTIKLYSPLFTIASFYIAAILGIIYISKIFVILIILDLIHSNYESDFIKSKSYSVFDRTFCILLFIYEIYLTSIFYKN